MDSLPPEQTATVETLVEDAASSPRPLKRRKIADPDEHVRKRVTRACEPCRRLKEKCNGVQPCTRCARYGRPCRFDLPPRASAKEAADSKDQIGSGHIDLQRVRKLEELVQHLTGVADVDKRDASQLDELLRQQPPHAGCKPLPSETLASEVPDGGSDDDEYGMVTTPHGGRYLGELSHNDFTSRLQNKVKVELHIGDTPESAEPVAPLRPNMLRAGSQVQSKSSLVTEAIAMIPPAEVAHFLVRIFFDYGQTNYCYVDETLIRDKLRELCASPAGLGINDAPWVCVILLILSVGTQFAHLDDRGGRDDQSLFYDGNYQSADDQLALRFYQTACKMIPDVLAAASVESVQAFLLFGIYALPIDVAGLACSYFGIAIRLATLNGMHRDHPGTLDRQQVEVRRRIWWTAYTLEKRMCVLHGRPISIAQAEVQCSLPSECPELQVFTNANNVANSIAMIKVTEMLETARDRIVDFRRAPKRERGARLQAIKQLQEDIDCYWNGLPVDTFCRDLDPAKPLFRSNLHLTLMYHLAHVFIGRSFILRKKPSAGAAALPHGPAGAGGTPQSITREGLVSRCIDSAVTVINLCQTLDSEVGIARASYTEFSSCSAALLAVLARRISAPGTAYLQTTCDLGLQLLKKMSVGIYANSEKLTVEALETAVRTLQSGGGGGSTAAGHTDQNLTQDSVRQAYARFRDWATLRYEASAAGGPRLDGLLIDPTLAPDAGAGEGVLLDQISLPSSDSVSAGYDPFYLGDFGSVPGLDEWFKYGLH